MLSRPIVLTHAALLLVVGAGVAACSSADDAENAAWTCTSSDVPMGEVVRCTQGALTMDGPAPDADVEEYDCVEGDVGCPPVGASGGTSDGPPGGAADGGGGAGSDGTGGTSDGPTECDYVPDLPYCDGGSGGSTPEATTDGGTSDGSGGSSSSGGTSDGSSGGPPGKPRFKCKEDGAGNKDCESVPDCVPGTHPSECGACVPDGEVDDCVPPSAGGCWVTGGGFIVGPNVTTGADPDGHDNFGGNAKPMKDGRIQGHWNHLDHGTGNHAKGIPQYIVCRHVDGPGPGQPGGKKGFKANQVYFGGPAEWRSGDTWASGYWFDVVAKDHGEPGSKPKPKKNGGMPDTYHFTIRVMDDPAALVSGAIVYETKGELVGGNIQLHPPNNGHPFTPMELPSWVSYEP